jgi:hypothetical protein
MMNFEILIINPFVTSNYFTIKIIISTIIFQFDIAYSNLFTYNIMSI